MFKLNFKEKYKVIHVTNELGDYVIGGAGTYLNELYLHRENNIGFVYVNLENEHRDFDSKGFLEQKDIAIINENELYQLKDIQYDIMVLHFYELHSCVESYISEDKKIVYVIHSVPTPEPVPKEDPFGGNDVIRDKFLKICDRADILVCVSNAEKNKLISLYPKYKDKIIVIHNGITYNNNTENTNYLTSRKIFGYIGRMDYRKGILECIKAIEKTDSTLLIACPINDDSYFQIIKNYLDGAKLWHKIRFIGWCTDKRKEEFFKNIDALCIPSLYEPFGYIALEAMNYMVPVISSDNGGLNEILEGYRFSYRMYTTISKRYYGNYCATIEYFKEK